MITDGDQCVEAKGFKALIFFMALYLVALGSGCVKPNMIAHDADQFNKKDSKQSKKLSSYFNAAHFAFSLEELVTLTLLVWLQTHSGMDIGFGVSAAALRLISLVCGTIFYKNKPPRGSIITPIAQAPHIKHHSRSLKNLSSMKFYDKSKSKKESAWAKFFDHGGGKVTSVESADEWMVDLSKLFIGLRFAHGAHSQLYHGSYKDEPVAVKMIRVPDDIYDGSLGAQLEKQFTTEVTLLSHLHHQNVIKLLLMKRGQVIYSGPLGNNSHKIKEYFEVIPGVPKIKEKYNPATWMLEVSSVAAERRLGMDFAEHYRSSALHQRNQALVKELSIPPSGARDLYFDIEYSQPTWGQFKSCLWKQWLSYVIYLAIYM